MKITFLLAQIIVELMFMKDLHSGMSEHLPIVYGIM